MLFAKCSRDVQSTRANWNLRFERDGEWNLKISKIMLDICKSPLYIDTHVRVCAEDRSENVRVWGGVHIVIRAGVRKRWNSEDAYPMWDELSWCEGEWGDFNIVEQSRFEWEVMSFGVRVSGCQIERGGIHVCEQSKCEKEVKDACPRWDELLCSDRGRACPRSIKGKLRKIILYWSRGTPKEMR